ncbi:hypothetical protein J437_LFUL009185 [Ladona fulva]|uniref:Uncharacterized protein n=1 Tax=Ladona fulva TaxID=123851 RepID=A0A8K0NYL1_LADFU|nr:hypothetical protein J437_LFUL009185 [Ladona fulva]
MISLPLTITCVVSLLPIRSTLCGDPLIWASVEAKAKFKANINLPDDGPGSECPIPSTFQMRADGSWLPSSEYDLNGYFDENCGIYLHVVIPEEEPEEGVELRSKIKELGMKKEELKKEADKLSKEEEEHESKLETLRNETKLLYNTKQELKGIEVDSNILKKKSENTIRERNVLMEEIENWNSFFEKDRRLSQEMSTKKKSIKLYEEINRLFKAGRCKKMKPIEFSEMGKSLNCKDTNKISICEPQ